MAESGNVMQLHNPDNIESKGEDPDSVIDTFSDQNDLADDLEYSQSEWRETMDSRGNEEITTEGDYSEWELEIE